MVPGNMVGWASTRRHDLWSDARHICIDHVYDVHLHAYMETSLTVEIVYMYISVLNVRSLQYRGLANFWQYSLDLPFLLVDVTKLSPIPL